MKIHDFKYKKAHKVRVPEGLNESKRACLQHGVYGLQVMESGRLTMKQLESARRTIKKHLKKDGQIWINVALNRFLTAKPAEVRMGKGKGSMSYAVTVVKAGTILFEIGGSSLSSQKACVALSLASVKLPLKSVVCEYSV